jgi:flagellar FliL protein
MNSFFNRSGKLPMIIIIVVAAVLVLGIGAVAFMKMHKGSHSHAKKKVDYVAWKFDEMLVTLADSEDLHYLKTSMTLEMEYTDKSKIPPEGEEDKEKPKALDVINSVCSGKTLAKLLPEAGKEKLKEEIIEKLNGKLENSQVREVYLTQFTLQ